MVQDGKCSQEYPVDDEFPQGSILGPTLFLLDINDLPDDVIYDIAIDADDTTLYSKLGFDNLCTSHTYVDLLLWRTHDFGHVSVHTYVHFFPYDFLEFSKFFWFSCYTV